MSTRKMKNIASTICIAFLLFMIVNDNIVNETMCSSKNNNKRSRLLMKNAKCDFFNVS